MATGITIQFDDSDAGRLAALPATIFRAQRSAITTTTTWAKKELQKRGAARSKLPKRVLRQFRVKSRRTREVGQVWIGLNPVKAAYVGPLKQDDGAAWAGPFYFEGGFVATMRSGHTGIFKRRADHRRGIVEQTVNIKSLLGPVIDEVAGEVPAQLRDRFTAKLAELQPK